MNLIYKSLLVIIKKYLKVQNKFFKIKLEF